MILTEQEQRAIHAFLEENWNKFVLSAHKFLTDEEIEQLGEGLGKDI